MKTAKEWAEEWGWLLNEIGGLAAADEPIDSAQMGEADPPQDVATVARPDPVAAAPDECAIVPGRTGDPGIEGCMAAIRKLKGQA